MAGCKSSTLLYGDTGDGKTALAGSWAVAIFAATGKPVRYYTAEPGGLATIAPLVDAGIIETYDVLSYPHAAEGINMVAQGYWPDASGKMVAPTPATWEGVGGVINEGGTSYCEMLLEELRQKGAMNEISGAEKPPQQYTSGALRVAGANQTYYGVVQGRIRKAINDSQRLPTNVLWTCRELKTEDDDKVSGFKEIYGPQLAGKAMTPHVPAWFGRTIHIDTVREMGADKKEKVVRRAFLKTHFYEGDRTPYVANPRLSPSVVSELPESILIKEDGSTMTDLLNLFETLNRKAKEMALARVGK